MDVIPMLNWHDLNGKSLVIHIGEDESKDGKSLVIFGHDIKENKLYLLHSEYTPNS